MFYDDEHDDEEEDEHQKFLRQLADWGYRFDGARGWTRPDAASADAASDDAASADAASDDCNHDARPACNNAAGCHWDDELDTCLDAPAIDTRASTLASGLSAAAAAGLSTLTRRPSTARPAARVRIYDTPPDSARLYSRNDRDSDGMPKRLENAREFARRARQKHSSVDVPYTNPNRFNILPDEMVNHVAAQLPMSALGRLGQTDRRMHQLMPDWVHRAPSVVPTELIHNRYLLSAAQGRWMRYGNVRAALEEALLRERVDMLEQLTQPPWKATKAHLVHRGPEIVLRLVKRRALRTLEALHHFYGITGADMDLALALNHASGKDTRWPLRYTIEPDSRVARLLHQNFKVSSSNTRALFKAAGTGQADLVELYASDDQDANTLWRSLDAAISGNHLDVVRVMYDMYPLTEAILAKAVNPTGRPLSLRMGRAMRTLVDGYGWSQIAPEPAP
jgi:hypothetical protein